MKCLIIIVLIAFVSAQDVSDESPVVNNETDYETLSFERDDEFGSGQESCDMHFVVYDKMYLRGVTEEFHELLNKTDFSQCAEMCCYKTSCVSFSHFAILEQCYLLDVTQADGFDLVPTPGFVHVQRVAPTTTAPPTTKTKFVTPSYKAPFESTKAPKSEKSVATKKGIEEGGQPGPSSASKMVGSLNLCSKKCQNDGECVQEHNVAEGVSTERCKCQPEFEGDTCEKVVTAVDEGFPSYLIAVIVVIAVLLILLIVVIVFCQIQKRKTGQYRVFGALREWARKVRRPKKAVSNDFFTPDEPAYNSSTVKSSGSLYDTIGRTPGPQSTSTSV